MIPVYIKPVEKERKDLMRTGDLRQGSRLKGGERGERLRCYTAWGVKRSGIKHQTLKEKGIKR